MNVLLLTAHDIAEYDDLRMLTDLGYDVFSIGAYTDPANPKSTLRPPLDVPYHADLAEACEEQRRRHAGDPMQEWIAGQLHHIVDWAKADLPQPVLDWADVIVCHHYLESWIVRQWDRLRDKRVVWRTCGQSNALLEETMTRLHAEGLEIVRYSPTEERAFGRMGVFAGQDALIRFGKPVDEYGPWIGDDVHVGNVTQNMAERGQACGLYWYLGATSGLPAKPAGVGSEQLPGGLGGLSYSEMLDYLRHVRCYVYTGTQPASYTLALMEAMLTGVPIVSIDPDEMWIPDLYEGAELVGLYGSPEQARTYLDSFLRSEDAARAHGAFLRERARALFDVRTVGRQWLDFLGAPLAVTYAKATAA